MSAEHSLESASPAPASLVHLVAAALAVTLFLAGLLGVSRYVDSVVARRIYAVAGSQDAQKSYGLVFQREALRHEDLLPLFGSSEMDRPSAYHAKEVFAEAPTGFTAFTIGKRATQVLATVQNLGALGSDLHGKRVVVSLSPGMFERPFIPDAGYAGNFSPLHALSVLVTPDLSAGLKRRIARRLLDHPVPLERNKVLVLTARVVADGRSSRRALLAAVLPLAHLQRQILALQDKMLVLSPILAEKGATDEPRQVVGRALDWPTLVVEATNLSKVKAGNSPFGVDALWWGQHHGWVQAQFGQWGDKEYVAKMQRSETWKDLEILLDVLTALGAKPLVFSIPFPGPFYDATGVSAASRARYYARVREVGDRYRVRVALLDDHENDTYFFYDLWGHISPKGWVYVDQVIDAFYHDSLD